MSYITLFKNVRIPSFEQAVRDAAGPWAASTPNVRRPTRGFVLKNDTYAKISVFSGASALKNSSLFGGTGAYTTNFLLQTMTETRNERVQFISTFGSTYAFFFGEQPRVVNCSAILLNSPDFNWEKEWWINYEDVLRGTSLTSANTKAVLEFDGVTVTGFLTNCSTTKNASDPLLVNVNFSMFVESIDYGDNIGSDSPYTSGSSDQSPTEFDEFESTTAAVRRANIALHNQAGSFLSNIQSALQSVDGAISSFVRKARNTLYGRNLVVPQSFVGQRFSTPVFPEGTGAEDLEGFEVTGGGFFGNKSVLNFSSNPRPGNSVTLRTNTDGFIANGGTQVSGKTWQNYDEYVTSPPDRIRGSLDNIEIASENVWGVEVETAVLNSKAVEAFAAFGLADAVKPYSSQSGSHTPAVYDTVGKSDIIRALARTAFGAVTFAVGKSQVEARKQVQASITNPNTGGLSASTIAQLSSEIDAAQRTSEQERLIAEAEADILRGNTGTVTP